MALMDAIVSAAEEGADVTRALKVWAPNQVSHCASARQVSFCCSLMPLPHTSGSAQEHQACRLETPCVDDTLCRQWGLLSRSWAHLGRGRALPCAMPCSCVWLHWALLPGQGTMNR